MAEAISAAPAESLDYAKTAVPRASRMPAFSLTMAWWSCCSAMFFIVISATLASAYGTKNAIIGIILSVISYSAINAVIARYAIRTGLSVALFSRLLFGTTGSALATLIFAATAIYYAVFEGSVIAIAATFLAPSLSYKIAALIVVLYSVPLVFGSVQNWLDKFNGVLLPFYIVGLLIVVALAAATHGYSNAWLSAGPPSGAPAGGWWNVYVAYMGAWILMMFCFDYARFGKVEDESYHALVNFGLPFYIVAFLVSGLAGIFLVNTIPLEGALSEVSAVKAIIVMMGALGLLFVWITQTRINTANYYLAAVNLESLSHLLFGLELPKFVWAIVVGVIVYVLMLADVFHYLLTALAYQGIFVVAWVGIAMAYMLSDAPSHSGAAVADDQFPAFNWTGLGVWFGAVIVGVVLQNIAATASFSGPASAVVSFTLYAALIRRTAPATV